MGQSYMNPGGWGNRTSSITVTLTGLSVNGGSGISDLVNGDEGDNSAWWNGAASGVYLKFTFSAARVIDEATWFQQTVGSSDGDWKWQGSNDNSTWTDIGGSFTITDTSPLLMTSLNGNVTAYQYYRLLGVSGTAQIRWRREAEFRIDGVIDSTGDFAPHRMTGQSSPSPYFVTESNEQIGGFHGWKAFDGLFGTNQYWLDDQFGSSGYSWLELDTGGSQVLGSYGISVNTIPDPTLAPKDWTMQGSNDNSTWTTLDTRTNQTSWASGEYRRFTCASIPGTFRYFRIYITANNGDATHVQLAELSLFAGTVIGVASASGSYGFIL